MMHQVYNYHSRLDYQKSSRRLYSFRRYSLRSLCLRHYSISSKRSSRSSYFIVLSALNSSQHMPFSGCSQKLIGLLSIYTTLLISLPNKLRSFTYQSISLSSSRMRSQCYCVRICLIFLVGSMRLITSSTQLLTPAEKMTGQHSSARQERKLSRFLRLQMLRRHSQSSNHRWKSSFLRGAIRYPSSSGVKVKASTSSISSTTVNFDGFAGGGSNLGFNLLASRIASAKYRLFLGLSTGGLASAVGFLLKLKKVLDRWFTSPLLIITQLYKLEILIRPIGRMGTGGLGDFSGREVQRMKEKEMLRKMGWGWQKQEIVRRSGFVAISMSQLNKLSEQLKLSIQVAFFLQVQTHLITKPAFPQNQSPSFHILDGNEQSYILFAPALLELIKEYNRLTLVRIALQLYVLHRAKHPSLQDRAHSPIVHLVVIEVNADLLLRCEGLSPEAFVLQKDFQFIQSDMNDPSIGKMQHVLNILHTGPIIRPLYLIKSRIPPFLLIAGTDLAVGAGDDHMCPLNGHLIDVLMIELIHLRLSC